MNKKLTIFLAGILLGISTIAGATSEKPAEAPAVAAARWHENFAYNTGLTAMYYAYPYLRMAEVRHRWTMAEAKLPALQPNHALNTFWHATQLVDASWQEGGAPNNDTLYSMAWVSVADEPMILSIPPIDRYFTFELSGFNSDNFAYVSELKHGRKGGHYALLPRGWQGELPEGVETVAEVPSPWILIAGRTYVADAEDIPAVRKLQQQYKLTPLSQWGQAQVQPVKPEVFEPYSMQDDPLGAWKTINRAMTENPPIGDETKIHRLFSDVNIGPGLDVEILDDASKRGLARAARDGLVQVKRAQIFGRAQNSVRVNGWKYNLSLGRAGADGNFALRTVHQSYAGIIANDPEEALYYGGFAGSDGKPLHGGKRYRIHIPRGGEPDTGAFWSISMYNKQNNFVANAIDRYSIGDRTENLVRDKDGSLTIFLQSERPTDPTVNWLPAPSGPFWLILRAYQPGAALLGGSWKPFPITVMP